MKDEADIGILDPQLDRRKAAPGLRGSCSDCGETLVARCGEINIWHWAHEAGASMCVGSGQESAWHAAWKLWAANTIGAATEVPDGRHRADIVTLDGRVIELQSGYLDARAIAAREEQYGDRLTWIYRIVPGRWDRLWNVGEGWFRWNRPALSMTRHERPVAWHHRDRLYDVTLRADGGDVLVKFAPGKPDRYGPVMYGSTPAPFDVGDALGAFARYMADSDANPGRIA